jgi:REP element-mobilizing transposase RayT
MRFPKRIRLDPAAYADADNVFHIVIRTHPEVGALPIAIRETIWESVLEQRLGQRIVLLAACLMPDHLHLLLKPGTVNVVSFLNRWKSWSTRLAWNAGHSGVLWQPSAWDRAIRSETEFLGRTGLHFQQSGSGRPGGRCREVAPYVVRRRSLARTAHRASRPQRRRSATTTGRPPAGAGGGSC